VYKVVEERFRKALRHHIHDRYKTDVPIVTERPPKLSMGEAASPVCFELAKRMKIKANYLYRVLPQLQKEGKVEKRDKGYHPPKD